MAMSNISSKPTGPIVIELYIETSGAEGTNGPGHMTNMAAMPVKDFKKCSYLEPFDW